MSSQEIQIPLMEQEKKDKMKSVIESLLFVSGEPLGLYEIAANLEEKAKIVEAVLEELSDEYENDKTRGIKIIRIKGKYQLVTKGENSDNLQKMLKKNKRQSLSQASLESLAIIVYKQPVTRIDIDEIRGVKSESAIQRLVERDLVKEVGRLEVPGRPILYGTTEEFLRQFGLRDLNDIPSLDLFEDNADNEENSEKSEEENYEFSGLEEAAFEDNKEAFQSDL